MSDITPYYLMIVDDEQHVVFIDLDEHGWATTYAEWMRRVGWWMLCRRDGTIVLTVRVNDGDQPYYTARHVGIASSMNSHEVTCYGIGKKTYDGQMVRLWVMPDGVVVGGDDVDVLGVLQVKARGPR